MKGHLRKRGDAWYLIFDLGTDDNGKRRQKWQRLDAKTKRDAEKEQVKVLNELHTGSYVEPAKMDVADYLRRWLNDSAKIRLEQSTWENYRDVVDLHLIPYLGHHPLTKLQPLHIQGYYSYALTQGRRRGKAKGTGLAPSSVEFHHTVLHSALDQAVRWQLLARNPADAVEPPKGKPAEVPPLDEAKTMAVLTALRESPFYIPALLIVTAGMRRGEVLALRWQDVDLQAGRISVRQAISPTRTGPVTKGPKSRKGRRNIALPGLALDALKTHRVEQAKRRLELGPAYTDDDLVVERGDGTPYLPATFSTAFTRLLKRLDAPKTNLRSLRHGHATHLLRAGVPAKVVSERLGHSTISITMDIYSHVMPGMQEEAAQRLDNLLRGVQDQPSKKKRGAGQ